MSKITEISIILLALAIAITGTLFFIGHTLSRQDQEIEELKEREYTTISLPTATSSMVCVMVKKVLREGVDSVGWFGAIMVEDIFKEAGGNPNMSINDVFKKRGIDPETCEVK